MFKLFLKRTRRNRRELSSGRKARPTIELLESRLLLTSVLDNGTLTITGSSDEDNITITAGSNSREVIVTGDPSHPEAQTFSDVSDIVVNAGDGHDFVHVDHDVKRPVTLNGEGGNDMLYGGGAGDILRGGTGDDTLVDSPGTDLYNGGDGNDTFSSYNGEKGLRVDLSKGEMKKDGFDGKNETIDNIRNVRGTPHNDVIIGDDNINVLWGEDGDDRINGKGGANAIYPGKGNDRVEADDDDNTVQVEGADSDIGRALNILLGDGNNTIDLELNDSSKLDLKLGDGHNWLYLWGGPWCNPKVTLGNGNNTLESTLGDESSLKIKAGDGTKDFDFIGGDIGKINIMGGDGDFDGTFMLGDSFDINLKVGEGEHDINAQGGDDNTFNFFAKLAPRISFSYDVTGDGKTVLRGSVFNQADISITAGDNFSGSGSFKTADKTSNPIWNSTFNYGLSSKFKWSIGNGTSNIDLDAGADSVSDLRLGSGSHLWDLNFGGGASGKFSSSGTNTGTFMGGDGLKFDLRDGADTITGSNFTGGAFKLGSGFDSFTLSDASGFKVQMGDNNDNLDFSRINDVDIRLGNCGADLFIRGLSDDVNIRGGKGADNYNFFERLSGIGNIVVTDSDGSNFFVTGEGEYDLRAGKGTDQFQLGSANGWGSLNGGSGIDDFLAIDPGISGLTAGINMNFNTGACVDTTMNYSISGFEYGRGSHLDDVLTAGKDTDRLSGGDGDDTFDAMGYSLYLIDGESGSDTLNNGQNVQYKQNIEKIN